MSSQFWPTRWPAFHTTESMSVELQRVKKIPHHEKPQSSLLGRKGSARVWGQGRNRLIWTLLSPVLYWAPWVETVAFSSQGAGSCRADPWMVRQGGRHGTSAPKGKKGSARSSAGVHSDQHPRPVELVTADLRAELGLRYLSDHSLSAENNNIQVPVTCCLGCAVIKPNTLFCHLQIQVISCESQFRFFTSSNFLSFLVKSWAVGSNIFKAEVNCSIKKKKKRGKGKSKQNGFCANIQKLFFLPLERRGVN